MHFPRFSAENSAELCILGGKARREDAEKCRPRPRLIAEIDESLQAQQALPLEMRGSSTAKRLENVAICSSLMPVRR